LNPASVVTALVIVKLALVSPAGTVTLLHTFLGGASDGRSPSTGVGGGLIQATDGNFYGTSRATDWGGLMAASTLTAIPVVIFFLLVQRKIAFGLTAGAVKA